MGYLFLFILMGILFALFLKMWMDTKYFKVNTVCLFTEKVSADDPCTILQISDLHDKTFGPSNQRLIDTVKRLHPDMIVLTGDVIDRHTTDFSGVFSLVEQLTRLHKHVFYVSGNHEWDNRQTEVFFEGLSKRNVTILNNQHCSITINDCSLNLVGVADVSTAHEDLEKAFRDVNRDSYTILLSHSPSIVEKYQHIPADLILSGHTHGGQIRMPFVGALIAPDQGYFPKLDKGIFKIGREQYLYIDSGIGTSNVPIRFLNKSQVSIIKIVHPKK